MTLPRRIAFYDFDGTLVSSNIVVRYAFYARHVPPRLEAWMRMAKLAAGVPWYFLLDHISRRKFNEFFFSSYAGLERERLAGLAARLFEEVIKPTIYPGARGLVERDRAEGFTPVLVSGELDFALAPVVGYFGFERLISNSLVFKNGVATGEVVPPLLAEGEKVSALERLCREQGADPRQARAYSDSFSDAPMLEAVGFPAAVHPDRRLRRAARERGWKILDLKRGFHGDTR